MSFNIAAGGLAPYLVLIVFGFLPSEVWRWISVVLARGLNESSEFFIYIRTVASVLLIGVVGRLVLTPAGALANVPLPARLGALAAGGAAFLIFRRSVLAAVLAGEAAIVLAGWWFVR
ncbi:MAG: AzlD domain-containing protein [Hyphomicrobiales bacterium]|nr:AzlD domain-containing protein [Hyphomicrobiales bacterium]